jgi:hypothetical protein
MSSSEDQYNELKQENDLIVDTIAEILTLIGVIPHKEGDNVLKKIMKQIPKLSADMIMDPQGIRLKFNCVNKLLPILDKYTDENGNIKKRD